MKKKQLLEKRAALQTEIEGRLKKAQAANDTGLEMDFPAELAEIDKLNEQLAAVNKDLEAIEKLEAQIRQNAAGSATVRATGAEVRSNQLDRPWESFGHYLQAVYSAEGNLRNGMPLDERLASGFNEGVGNEGAFLVGTDVAGPVIEQTFETGAISSRCRTFPISSGSNGVKIPAYADKTRTNGNRNGGVQAYWAAEAAEYTATTPKPFEKVELSLEKMIALCYATDELLNDAAALNAWIGMALPEEMSFKLDDAIIRGTGVGVPLGILNSSALVSVAKEGSQTAATVNAANVTKMYARMPARLKSTAVWFINDDVFPQLQLMTSAATSASQMIYLPPGGFSASPYGSLFGRPVIPVEYCETLGTKGDILFCAFPQYALARKGGIKQQVSIHVRFLYDETAFKFTMRVDGKPLWNTSITPYKGTNAQSPFISLDTRA